MLRKINKREKDRIRIYGIGRMNRIKKK